jgi:hypothetical protein
VELMVSRDNRASRRMFKKALVPTRPTLASISSARPPIASQSIFRDAPYPGRGRSERRGESYFLNILLEVRP